MIKIKPLTKEQLLTETKVLSNELSKAYQRDDELRKIITSLLKEDNKTFFSPSSGNSSPSYLWEKICFEIGKLKQANNEFVLNQTVLEQTLKIEELEAKIRNHEESNKKV